jgi:hypothetical protein
MYMNMYFYMSGVIYMASGRNVALGVTAVNGPRDESDRSLGRLVHSPTDH